MATCVGKDFNDELTCALCLDSWRSPIECVPCGHIFCRDCLPKSSKSCPLCRGTIASVKEPHRSLINLCEQVQVECQGCKWCGTREQSYTHVCTRKPAAPAVTTAAAPNVTRKTSNVKASGVSNLSTYDYMDQYAFLGDDEYNLRDIIDSDSLGTFGKYGQGSDPSVFEPWVKYGMTRAEYDQCLALFKSCDESNVGSLNFPEVFKLCRVLNYTHTPAEVARLFAEMDTNGNNRISQDELLTWMSQHKPDHEKMYGMSLEQYRDAAQKFTQHDRDGDGWVNASDFASLCRATRVASTDKEAKNMFQNLDTDRNGLINLNDYLQAYQFREL